MSGPIGPAQRYRSALEADNLQADAAQQRAVEALQRVWDEVAQQRRGGWLRGRKPQRVRGVYMHGGVGRGKTMLMDLLAETLPARHTLRMHFHHFMADTHESIGQHKDTADPLEPIAAALARNTRVLCFDEFFVSDVADAMILGRLMTRLFAHGLTLVATSNIAPENLYPGGLQRERFLPAIAALQQHCEVLSVDGDTDYRLRELQRAPTYHHPLGAHTDEQLLRRWQQLTAETPRRAGQVRILGRDIDYVAAAQGVAWFDFEALCGGPRAASDYIELAREFGTVLLAEVPQMDYSRENEARRFLHLIDEFYDRRVKLILSAAVPLNQLYAGQRLSFEFARARSRLEEMQSVEYLALPHQPV